MTIKNIQINQENIVSEKGALSLFQLTLLIISTIAFSYIISSGLKITSASTQAPVCCEKTIYGNYCQDALENNCNSSLRIVPSNCSEVEYCKKGCCYSDKTGTCNKATPKILCDGEWIEDKNCNLAKCQKGCCVLGRQTLFVEERRCQVKSNFLGIEMDFRKDIKNEADCIFLAEKDDLGACVYGESCRFITKESCKKTGGEFYLGKYCSDPAFKTDCEAKARAGCFEESAYWYDSCDNRESIKEKCDIFDGTICGLVGTDYKCKSINCQVTINGKKVTKKNGESWCEYEGTIGNGSDVPGSIHIRHSCYLGEERVEECDDYRNEVCIEGITTSINGSQFVEAKCKLNEWRQCLEYNSKKNGAELCNANPYCTIKRKTVEEEKFLFGSSTTFSVTKCVPKYPPGFDFNSEDEAEKGVEVCSAGTVTCKVIYKRSNPGDDYDCKENCDCEEMEFTEKINEICASFGDCGAYVNIIGEVTEEGYSIYRAPKLSNKFLETLKKFAVKVSGQKAILDTENTTEMQLGVINNPSSSHGTLGKAKKKYVKFTCMPWQPPIGGEDCEKCNNFTSCTEYKCESLGLTCALVNKGTKFQTCVNNAPNDVSSPKITPLYGVISEGFEYRNVKEGAGFEIKDSNGDCMPEFTNVVFGIKTNKPAQCVIGNDSMQDFDSMKNSNFGYFGGSNLYVINHTTYITFPSSAALKDEYEDITPEEIEGLGELNLFVKCRGLNGKENDAAYLIKSCVKEGPTYPYIRLAIPENNGYIAYSATELNATFYVNEPSDCKYSLNDVSYDLMENSITCATSLEDNTYEGFMCNATLDVSLNTKFYLRCKDKSEYNMTMENNYVYELKRSESELRIVIVDPKDGKVIRAGSEPVTLTLEAATAGGAFDGVSGCDYEFIGRNWFGTFQSTGQKKHKQIFTSIMGGDYTILVECKDLAGNIVSNTTSFTVNIDNNAPIVTRAYYENGLKIATNEDSTCAYSTTDSKCKFNIGNLTKEDNAEQMSGNGKEHTGKWQTDLTYYIKCNDEYGNSPGKCSFIARPWDTK